MYQYQSHLYEQLNCCHLPIDRGMRQQGKQKKKRFWIFCWNVSDRIQVHSRELITRSFGFAAKAGFLSGSTGIESVPGPKLPEIDFLNRFNGLILDNLYYKYQLWIHGWCVKWHHTYCPSFPEENQKKYAEFDARFKSSPLLKEYLEKSKSNKEK